MGPDGERQSARILLIEDDADIAEMYRWRLQKDGYQVEWSEDGLKGLAAAFETLPDLVFLDIRLPQLDGIEVLRRLRAERRTRRIPVVVITNYDDPRIKYEARELGAMEYLIKSRVTPTAIATAVTKWLKRTGADGAA